MKTEFENNLKTLGYHDLSQIQQQCIPHIKNGDNIIAQAKTGSGKTLAFTIAIDQNIDPKIFRIQVLVLTPTRELANQVAQKIKSYLRFRQNIKVLTLCGGLPYKPQVHSLKHLAHIVVGTAGRILKHLEEKNFSCSDINTFILDEADRMLDMGFSEDILKIASYLPHKRQNLLFSATFPSNIQKLSQMIMEKSVFISVEDQKQLPVIDQKFFKVTEDQKNDLILHCFCKDDKSIIIFVNTKQKCEELADFLVEKYDCHPLVLHSDYDQKDRDETLVLFENKSYPVLIATDVASRGLDIDRVDLVINYDLPYDSEVYVHRIGRSARAGKSGKSISFVDDTTLFDDLCDYLQKSFDLYDWQDLATESIQKPTYDFSTLYISGGKKLKLRAGDILGALTAGVGLNKNDIGKIAIFDRCSYVAIKNEVYEKALKGLNNTKIKNKDFRVYKR
ncbi:MAG: ATP-dependent RNA helicase DbpA [Campylobacterales bacterium]|nr:ATP-dependent RNA helicase DbpA [Campylobacterales bacterium]